MLIFFGKELRIKSKIARVIVEIITQKRNLAATTNQDHPRTGKISVIFYFCPGDVL